MVAQAKPGKAPPPVLEDEVLRLRPLTIADATAWHEGEDEEIRRWFQFPRPSSRQDVTRAIQAWSRSWAEGGPVRNFGVWVKSEDLLIGGVEIRDRGEGSAYLSYVVFAEHRRRGHAARAVELAGRYAMDVMGVSRLVIITDEANMASRKVAESAGFDLEGPADPQEHVEIGQMLRYVRGTAGESIDQVAAQTAVDNTDAQPPK